MIFYLLPPVMVILFLGYLARANYLQVKQINDESARLAKSRTELEVMRAQNQSNAQLNDAQRKLAESQFDEAASLRNLYLERVERLNHVVSRFENELRSKARTLVQRNAFNDLLRVLLEELGPAPELSSRHPTN